MDAAAELFPFENISYIKMISLYQGSSHDVHRGSFLLLLCEFSDGYAAELVSDGIIDQSGNSEFMPVAIALLGDGLQEMDMSAVANRNRALCFSCELMKMVLVKIRPEFYLMNVVAHPDGNDFTGHRCKPMVVRVGCGFRNPKATKHFVDVGLLPGAA